MSDDLRQRLREAADAHQPDRARMLARIERGMAQPPSPDVRPARRRPAVGWTRIAGVTAGVAGVLAVGGFAVGAALRPDEKPRQTVAASPTPSTPSPAATSREPAPSAPASGAPSRPAPEGHKSSPSPSATPSKSSDAKPPAAPDPQDTSDGPLWSDGSVDPGSNDYWGQSDVTFRTREQLTSLTVELRIAQTGKVADTGNWRSLPADDFTVSVGEHDGFLVYRWELKPGKTVPTGEFVFAGQYNHADGGRDAQDDTYTVTARTKKGERAAVGGDFA
ncbi:hypothetical protein [Streptomyces sp. VRA16 Mangrove soil]|uniref:hypothetical protein n=1 Tax=Streptomyces sp. VRA16 Mangrove soil TaxID=2817434 RepID=UPI001A9F7C1A|nr:hypothetical protein [Streptomyces sp. VRA16 Mangrove soil]MBO1335249.1 hypothetical protein [Streptomyces sp. VRA16 Mangrove soil]